MAWLTCIPNRIVGHNPCYTPSKIGTVTGVSGSVETAAVCLLNAVFHLAVFHIIGLPTQDNKKHI